MEGAGRPGIGPEPAGASCALLVFVQRVDDAQEVEDALGGAAAPRVSAWSNQRPCGDAPAFKKK